MGRQRNATATLSIVGIERMDVAWQARKRRANRVEQGGERAVAFPVLTAGLEGSLRFQARQLTGRQTA